MKILALILAASLAICSTGCSSVASIATQLSSATPTQVSTLADAEIAATAIRQAVDIYVKNGAPSQATLLELQTLNNGLQNALIALRAANAANQSLLIAGFNEALDAFISYSTTKGVQT